MFAWLKKIFFTEKRSANPQYRGKKKHRRKRTFNCARVYVGTYVGGGTNEFERGITCGYGVLEGNVGTKRLKPTRIRWTTSEGQTSLLQTFVIYPKTETAVITITNSYGSRRLRLVRAQNGERRTIFKARA
jgi:hypothetical protein